MKMIPIKQLLNKIKWDKKESPEDYLLYYYDRLENQLKELKYLEIKRIDDNFLILEQEGREISIPLHRIRKVKKRGVFVWER